MQRVTSADLRVDQAELMRECFTVARRRIRRVPEEDGIAWTDRLCGLLLTAAGASKMRRIEPGEIPAGWVLELGRPKKAA